MQEEHGGPQHSRRCPMAHHRRAGLSLLQGFKEKQRRLHSGQREDSRYAETGKRSSGGPHLFWMASTVTWMGFWSVSKWMISRACFTIRTAMICTKPGRKHTRKPRA